MPDELIHHIPKLPMQLASRFLSSSSRSLPRSFALPRRTMAVFSSLYPKLKLTYFDMSGRAEAIRIMLFASGIPFEDERLSREQFAKRKDELPYSVMPVLEVDGKVLGESQAILRYVGRLTKSYPMNDPIAALLVDDLFGAIDSLGAQFKPVMTEQDPTKRAEKVKQLVTEDFPRCLAVVDAQLEHMSTLPSFNVPEDQLLIHEVWVNSMRQNFIESDRIPFIPSTLADGYKQWMRIAAKVAAHPKVKLWDSLKHSVPQTIKLTTLNDSLRGDAIRLALFIGDIPFEDASVDRSPSGSMTPLVPALSVDGLEVAQSAALLRYAGSLSGLYPSSVPFEAFHIDELMGPISEVVNVIDPILCEQDPQAKVAISAGLMGMVIPTHLGALNARLGHWADPYATGADMTIADLQIYELVALLKSGALTHVPTTVVDQYTHVVAVHDHVRDHPKVQAWRAEAAKH